MVSILINNKLLARKRYSLLMQVAHKHLNIYHLMLNSSSQVRSCLEISNCDRLKTKRFVSYSVFVFFTGVWLFWVSKNEMQIYFVPRDIRCSLISRLGVPLIISCLLLIRKNCRTECWFCWKAICYKRKF